MADVLSLGKCHYEGSMIRYIIIIFFDCTANKIKILFQKNMNTKYHKAANVAVGVRQAQTYIADRT